jgi:hypothetical protein
VQERGTYEANKKILLIFLVHFVCFEVDPVQNTLVCGALLFAQVAPAGFVVYFNYPEWVCNAFRYHSTIPYRNWPCFRKFIPEK